MTPVIDHYDEIDVSVVYTLGSNELYVDFRASKIEGRNCWDNGVHHERGYASINESSNMPVEFDPAKGEIYVSGSVKWDGCVNFEVGDDNGVMLHACNEDDLARLSKTLIQVRRRSKQLMPKADF
jgi:L-rhamnose isomerase